MSNDMNHPDELDEVLGSDSGPVSDALRSLRDTGGSRKLSPDAALMDAFENGRPPIAPSVGVSDSGPAAVRPRRRPLVAFGVAFGAVLVVGAGLALGTQLSGGSDPAPGGDQTTPVAAPSIPDGPTAAVNDALTPTAYQLFDGEYLDCARNTTQSRVEAFRNGEAPEAEVSVTGECGLPERVEVVEIPDALEDEVDEWLTCVHEHLEDVFPDLPQSAERIDPVGVCGQPPDPEDFGVELPRLVVPDFEVEKIIPDWSEWKDEIVIPECSWPEGVELPRLEFPEDGGFPDLVWPEDFELPDCEWPDGEPPWEGVEDFELPDIELPDDLSEWELPEDFETEVCEFLEGLGINCDTVPSG